MKKLSIFLVVFILSLVLVSTAVAEEYYVNTSWGKLNIRNGPGKEYKIVGRFKKGQVVDVLEYDGEWAVIEYKGKVSYVMSSFLSKDPLNNAIQSDCECIGGTTTLRYVHSGDLNVRQSASTHSPRIGKVTRGTKLNVHSIENGWARICLGGKDAFVMEKFISEGNPEIDDSTGAPSFGGVLYVTKSSVNVRGKPSTESGLVQRLSSGSVVEVLSVEGEWAKIKYRGYRDGYIMVEFITPK